MKRLFKAAGAPPYSAVRDRLAELIAARNEASAAMAVRQLAITRLAGELAIGDAASGELDALDTADAAALADWARAGEGDSPRPDVAKREALAKRATEATARAVALTRAHAGLVAEQAVDAAKIPAIAQKIDADVESILLEEAEPMLDELRVASAAVAAQTVRLNHLAAIVNDRAGLSIVHGVSVPGASPALAVLIGKVKNALVAAPDDDGASQSRMAWLALASDLRSDSNARLES